MTDNIIKRSNRETEKAKRAATADAIKWHTAELAKIEAPGLEGAELRAAKRGLGPEMARRLKAGKSRARSQNTVAKLIEREIRDEKERDSATRPD